MHGTCSLWMLLIWCICLCQLLQDVD